MTAESKNRLRPELQALVACLAQPLQAAALGPQAAGPLLHTLAAHRLSNVFYLATKGLLTWPPGLQADLQAAYRANSLRLLGYTYELCRVMVFFQQKGIEAVALKGPLLGQLYYGHYTCRECGDLDILVKPSDRDRAYRCLQQAGYSLSERLWSTPTQQAVYTRYFHHYRLYHPAHNVQLELHWRLNADMGRLRQQTDWFYDRLTTVTLSGHSIAFLAASDHFIYLCIHGGLHNWRRLFWLYDIVKIMEKEGPAFLENAYKQAVSWHVDRYVLLACGLAVGLFGAVVPESIQRQLGRHTGLQGAINTCIFSMNHVTDVSRSPVASWHEFGKALRKTINFYRNTYYLSGPYGLLTECRKFFINPAYWQVFAFADRRFALNYAAAPFLWGYSMVAAALKKTGPDA